MSYRILKFGWQPNLPDQCNFKYKAPRGVVKTFLHKIRKRKKCPLVYYQKQPGSCTSIAGNLTASAGNKGIIAHHEKIIVSNSAAIAGNAPTIAVNKTIIANIVNTIAKHASSLAGNRVAMVGKEEVIKGHKFFKLLKINYL